FAFALWDREARELSLVRDRLGIKPLFYGRVPGGVVFGSELRALARHPGFEGTVAPDAVAAFLRYCYVPTPHTIFREAKKVVPGTILRFRGPRFEAAAEEVYWSAIDVAVRGRRDPLDVDEAEATDLVHEALRAAVSDRMVADVPLGAFLSGGIDSSTVVALMQEASPRPVKTFSIGNERSSYDEGEDAQRVAAHLGTDHTALTVTAAEALAVVPELARMYDEPFADASQIPTHLVSRLARREVTVALSGDGGDEVFGGYNRHLWAPRVWRLLEVTPRPLRSALRAALESRSADEWNQALSRLGPLAPPVRLPGDKLHKLARVLEPDSPAELYRGLCSTWPDPSELVERGGEARPREHWSAALPTFRERLMLADLITYLTDDILTKVDRASMSVSLEARVPILDHRVVELAWRLPLDVKIRRGRGKRVLRAVLDRYVPRALVERPKMGFGVPIGDWLRGPLRDWAEGLLDEGRMRDAGLRSSAVRATWREHLDGRRSHDHRIWATLMYLAWHDQLRDTAWASRAATA
ncbi:MAG: asparagine synthase (glutamine-hydrolyzing), partial [Myxococcales bacterium]|nr:asparagine synthase (glutamine-hydrolyzing) [Myxococcales bacterium]